MREALESAARYLESCGVESPQAEAEILMAAALGIDRGMLGAMDRVPGDAQARFNRWVARRGEKREPTAYILEKAPIRDIVLRVTPSVLIPRPSTETLLDRALTLRPATVLDIGTGSGAIAIVLARAGAAVTATDTSDRALAVARRNAERLGVKDRIDFRKADLFVPGKFDLVVSNPPYVTTTELEMISPEVRHEPREALDGGLDGLSIIRRVLAGRPGHLLLEVGAGQASVVSDLALHSGFRDVRWWKDLQGIDRVLEAT